MAQVEVIAIDLDAGSIITDDGRQIPVYRMLDEYGDEVGIAADAVFVIALMPGDSYIEIDIREFRDATLH
ncbi:hypothetical protein [Aurantimonas sp. C2-4-R8]|nr:hypothetical protein [Aurantimonas sp. C2-3-R2]